MCLRWLTESYWQRCRNQFSFRFNWLKHIHKHMPMAITIGQLNQSLSNQYKFTICLNHFQNYYLHFIEWPFIVRKCVNWFVYRIPIQIPSHSPTNARHSIDYIHALTFPKQKKGIINFQFHWNVKHNVSKHSILSSIQHVSMVHITNIFENWKFGWNQNFTHKIFIRTKILVTFQKRIDKTIAIVMNLQFMRIRSARIALATCMLKK